MVHLKRKNLIVVSSLAFLALFFLFLNSSSRLTEPKPLNPGIKKAPSSPVNDVEKQSTPDLEKDQIQEESLGSIELEPFMPKMANETLKAELGRASWRLFHTILARYPDDPTTVEKETLSQYIHLFSKVYPCGDCARHFAKLLQKYPPQLNSRQIASVWGCHIHNKVNDRLGKPTYDCTTILEDYDCGCGADEEDEAADLAVAKAAVAKEVRTADGGDDKKAEADEEHFVYELNKESKQLG